MNLLTDVIFEKPDLSGCPGFRKELCLNRRQRRISCTACADVCPHGVFPLHSGEPTRWNLCTDCGLCVAACPTRALTPSAQTARQYTDALEERGPVRFTCRREEHPGDVRTGCLAELPWELLAVMAMHEEIILCTGGCEACAQQGPRRLLEENLKKLETFLGQARFSRQVRQLRAGEEPPQAKPAAPEKDLTRRELFAGLGRGLAREAAKGMERRLPSLAGGGQDPLALRKLLAETVREEKAGQSPADRKSRDYGLSLPRFTVSCFGCGICEKLCPHGALSFLPEEGGTRLVMIEPWRCTACGLCAALCPHGGLDGLKPVALPHLDRLALVRVQSASCRACGAVLKPGTEPPLCRRCAKKQNAGK